MLLTAVALKTLVVGSSGLLLTAAGEARRLSAELRVPVEVSSPLRAEILYVNPHGLSPKIELAAVAGALHASAIRGGTGFLIERTAKEEQSIRQKLAVERGQWIDSELAATKRYRSFHTTGVSLAGEMVEEIHRQWKGWHDFQLQKGPPPTFTHPVREILPCEVLLEGIVERFGTRTLGAIPAGTIQVYETEPAAGAKPIGQIDDLVRDYTEGLSKYATLSLPPETMSEIQGWPDMQALLSSSGPAKKPEQLRFKVSAFPAGLFLALEVFDTKGTKLDGAELLVTSSGNMPSPSSVLAESAGNPDHVSAPLTEPGLEAASYRFAAHPDRFPDWFLAPDRTEPLSLFVQSALSALAERDTTSCVVADVPDCLWGIGSQCVSGKSLDVSAFQRLASFYVHYERVADGNTVYWRTGDPEYFERDRANRAELSRFAKDVASRGDVATRAVARLYHAGGDTPWTWPKEWQAYAVNNDSHWSTTGNLTDRFYALIGAISDDDWSALESGATLTAGRLGVVSELQALIDEDVVTVSGRGKVPDLMKHAAEAFKSEELADVPIILGRSTLRAIRPWLASSTEGQGWIVGKGVEDTMYSTTAYLEGDGARVAETREQFEARSDKEWWFKLGTIAEETLYIGQGQSYFVRGDIPTDDVESSARLSYSDLPLATRDQIWRAAGASAIASTIRIANLRGRDGVSASPTIIPPR